MPLMREHPFATGLVVGAVGLLAWWKRHAIATFFRQVGTRVRHPFAGTWGQLGEADDSSVPAPVRHLRRYAFASTQDRSPIAGLTHASYAMMALDLIEETAGREAIARAGYNPQRVRAFVAGLQDRHAEALKGSDPYITRILAMERGDEEAPAGFLMTGAAPMGA